MSGGAPKGNHNHLKHGMRNTRLYNIWRAMRQRCNNPRNSRYSLYGGRGISVCKEWEVFENFYQWAMKSGYKEDLTIDRKNTDGNYEPSNCKWSTQKEQQNNRRNNTFVIVNGVSHTVSEWAEIIHVKSATLRAHLKRGNTVNYILEKL